MVKTLKRAAPAVAVLGIAALWMTARPTGQTAGFPSTKNGDWTHYTADIRGSKYMPLDQITTANFMFVNIGSPAKAFRDACRAKNVMVARDFPPFHQTHARISLGTMEEMQKAVNVFGDVLGKKSTAAA